MFYTYNFKAQKWRASNDDVFFQLFTPISTRQKRAWCSVHQRWETCARSASGRLRFECGNPILSPFAAVNDWTLSKVEVVPDDALDTVKVRADLVFTYFCGGTKRCKYAYRTWRLCMKSGFIVPYESSEWLSGLDIKIPDSIASDIQNYLSEYAESLVGKKLSNSSPKSGMEALSDFVVCPACPQLADLRGFLGPQYSQIVDRKNSNPYQDVCDYIHVKPFKRMRRIFDKNPLALPVYGVLKRWGFCDVNVMTKFLEDKRLCEEYFGNVKYDFKTKRIVMRDESMFGALFYFRGEAANDIVTVVDRWLKESLSVQPEKNAMNNLIKAMKDEYNNFFDAAQMYYSRGAAVPDTLKKRIQKECFTREIHDALVEAFPRTYKSSAQNEEIPYLEKDKILNATLKGERNAVYEFILPKDTNELYDLGSQMHNCVGHAYRRKALERQSIIVGVKENGFYSACLEINPRFNRIVQARGVCNANLTCGMKLIVAKWAKERGISY